MTVMKLMQYEHYKTGTQMTGSPETKHQIHGQLAFDKDAKITQGGKSTLFNN